MNPANTPTAIKARAQADADCEHGLNELRTEISKSSEYTQITRGRIEPTKAVLIGHLHRIETNGYWLQRKRGDEGT